MQRQAVLVCFASLLLLCIFQHAQGCIDTLRNERGDLIVREWPLEAGVDYVKDQVVFKARPEALILPQGLSEASIEECTVSEELLNALLESNAYYVMQVYAHSTPADTLHQIDDSLYVIVPDVSNNFLCLLQDGSDVYYAVDALCALDTVIWAEPNAIGAPCAVPNDTYYQSHQWNLKGPPSFGIDCERAWDIEAGKSDVILGIVDSGLSSGLGEFAGRILGGCNYHVPPIDETPCDEYDWGSDGLNDAHGNKVAGVAAARTNNSMGVAGVAGGWNNQYQGYGAVLYSLRITNNDPNESGSNSASLANAIKSGGDQFDCDILNISWGFDVYTEVIHEAVVHAQAARRIIVASAGNLSGENPPAEIWYPAAHDDNWVLSIGSYGQDGVYCSHREIGYNCPYWSNYRYPMDILAPGVDIATVHVEYDPYDFNFGATSAAAAHVSGVAALILSKRPALWSEDVEWMIETTAIEAGDPEYDIRYGWGRLNAGNLFTTLLHPTTYNGNIYRYVEIYSGPQLTQIRDEEPTVFYGEYAERFLDPGQPFQAECYEAVYQITYPDIYASVVGAWGNRFGVHSGELGESSAWSQADPNYTEGYCEVVPQSQTLTGCQLRSYFFYADVGGDWQWLPYDPVLEPTTLCYSVWGIKKYGNPNGPEEGKKSTEIAVVVNDNCYPNPSNSSFQIVYELTADQELNVTIFDILGRKVRDLFSGKQSKGGYAIIWDGRDNLGNDLSSGIYLYRIAADDFSRLGRMVILK
jgi:subtilisin family serine protease